PTKLKRSATDELKKEVLMPKKLKALCVCSVINELGIFYGNQLQGEIYFKHSAKCSQKTNGTFE
ncbi:17289_t:CDS:1, partial [Entrophospora sp. SA101]